MINEFTSKLCIAGGKCTQRNFWMGESRVKSLLGSTSPPAPGNAKRFFKPKNLSPPGSLYSMAKPTKSFGGCRFFPIHGEKRHAIATVKFQ